MRKTTTKILVCLTMCMGCTSAWALSQVNGYYQISTGQDLADFAAIVNETGDIDANGELTADIDMAGVEMAPIGNMGTPYRGNFKGNGHRINNLNINLPEVERVGLFGVIEPKPLEGSTISGIILSSSCRIVGKHAVALIGAVRGQGEAGLPGKHVVTCGAVRISCCGNEGYIQAANGQAAGIMAVNFGDQPAYIDNCFNAGEIVGTVESAAISGWLYGDHFSTGGNCVTNCFNVGTITGADADKSFARGWKFRLFNCYDVNQSWLTPQITSEDVTGGALCYAMNGGRCDDKAIWRQTLGDEEIFWPVPTGVGDIVSASGDVVQHDMFLGELTYTNAAGTNHYGHDMDATGVCRHCGLTDFQYHEISRDVPFTIDSPEKMAFFCSYAKNFDPRVSANLTTDIDFAPLCTLGNGNILQICGQVDAGSSEEWLAYQGVFDGQGHKINIKYENPKVTYAALFGAVNAGIVRNLWVTGSITLTSGDNGIKHAAGLVGCAGHNATFENIVSEVNITDNGTNGFDGTDAGICAHARDNCVFHNVIYAGNLNAPNTVGHGGIVGYAHGGGDNQLYLNCAVVGDFNVQEGGAVARNAQTFSNCYYKDTDPTGNWPNPNTSQIDPDYITQGVLCWFLNGMKNGGDTWRQEIGVDPFPVPAVFGYDRAKVYAVDPDCSGMCEGEFTNTPTQLAEHNMVGSTCSNCGYTRIANAQDMIAFSTTVVENPKAVGELVADIDFDGVAFNGIGFTGDNARSGDGIKQYEGVHYQGEFIGNGHHIKNLIIDGSEKLGLFTRLGDGAHLHDFVIDNTCEFKGFWNVGAICGWTGSNDGGPTNIGHALIERVGVEAVVNGTGNDNTLMTNSSERLAITMNDCYAAGTLNTNMGGTYTGWTTTPYRYTNCFDASTITTTEHDGNYTCSPNSQYRLVRSWQPIQVKGLTLYSYQLNHDWYGTYSPGTYVPEADYGNGKLTELLNAGRTGVNAVWKQGEYFPVLTGNIPTGISEVGTMDEGKTAKTAIYTVNGMRLNKTQRGLNIMKMNDGTVKKVLVK